MGNSLGDFQERTISSLSLRNFAEGREFWSALFLFEYLTYQLAGAFFQPAAEMSASPYHPCAWHDYLAQA